MSTNISSFSEIQLNKVWKVVEKMRERAQRCKNGLKMVYS